jgi:hypothetical protein
VKQYSTGRIYSWLFDTLPDSDGESDYEWSMKTILECTSHGVIICTNIRLSH